MNRRFLIIALSFSLALNLTMYEKAKEFKEDLLFCQTVGAVK